MTDAARIDSPETILAVAAMDAAWDNYAAALAVCRQTEMDLGRMVGEAFHPAARRALARRPCIITLLPRDIRTVTVATGKPEALAALRDAMECYEAAEIAFTRTYATPERVAKIEASKARLMEWRLTGLH